MFIIDLNCYHHHKISHYTKHLHLSPRLGEQLMSCDASAPQCLPNQTTLRRRLRKLQAADHQQHRVCALLSGVICCDCDSSCPHHQAKHRIQLDTRQCGSGEQTVQSGGTSAGQRELTDLGTDRD